MLTVSFFVSKTGWATVIMSDRPWNENFHIDKLSKLSGKNDLFLYTQWSGFITSNEKITPTVFPNVALDVSETNGGVKKKTGTEVGSFRMIVWKLAWV